MTMQSEQDPYWRQRLDAELKCALAANSAAATAIHVELAKGCADRCRPPAPAVPEQRG